jgi:hypothetical protein
LGTATVGIFDFEEQEYNTAAITDKATTLYLIFIFIGEVNVTKNPNRERLGFSFNQNLSLFIL